MPKSIQLSSRIQGVTPFLAIDIFQEALQLVRDGREIFHLEIGEPDFPTPAPTVKAGINAIQKGLTLYTHSMGILELREAICDHYYNMHKVKISPDCVIVSSGSSILLHSVINSLLEPDDEVIISNPSYACYANYVRIAGGKPVLVPVLEEEGFVLSTERLRQAITPRTKAIIICSPGNPTGVVIPKENIRQITSLAKDANIALIADEIYHGLSYEEPVTSVLEYSQDNCFVLNGFSKYFSMTGWRLGYLICPPHTADMLTRIHQNVVVCASDFVQRAGIAAIRETIPICEKYRQEYDNRRRYLLKELPKIGLKLNYTPQGAFYVLVNVKKYSLDSLALARQIMNKTGVVLSPGVDFGPGGEGYLRISYANSLENIKKSLERLENFFSNFHKS